MPTHTPLSRSSIRPHPKSPSLIYASCCSAHTHIHPHPHTSQPTPSSPTPIASAPTHPPTHQAPSPTHTLHTLFTHTLLTHTHPHPRAHLNVVPHVEEVGVSLLHVLAVRLQVVPQQVRDLVVLQVDLDRARRSCTTHKALLGCRSRGLRRPGSPVPDNPPSLILRHRPKRGRFRKQGPTTTSQMCGTRLAVEMSWDQNHSAGVTNENFLLEGMWGPALWNRWRAAHSPWRCLKVPSIFQMASVSSWFPRRSIRIDWSRSHVL